MPIEDRTLSGIRVVELGEMVSVPYCARLMALWGRSGEGGVTGGGLCSGHGPFPGDEAHLKKADFSWR